MATCALGIGESLLPGGYEKGPSQWRTVGLGHWGTCLYHRLRHTSGYHEDASVTSVRTTDSCLVWIIYKTGPGFKKNVNQIV